MRLYIQSGLLICVTLLSGCSETSTGGTPLNPPEGPPNIVLILTDDLGYGDLGCYDSTLSLTPHLDRLASEGVKLTSFYAFPTCSPSRAALLSGCYPARVGIPDVLAPPGPAWTRDKQHGIHPDEELLPELLAERGYATGMVGKWHLGHFPKTLPTRHGFQEFFGLPYSNDMLPEGGYGDLVLFDGTDTLERNPDQTHLTERYTQRAEDFIHRHADTSFFLYLAHSMPHVPLFTSEPFAGRSRRGLYADVVEELDASTGRILAALEKAGVADNTLVIFTSDNGPWLSYGNHGGNAGPLREGKGTSFEGGVRVPFLARWPAGGAQGVTVHEPMSLIDVLPTLVELTGAERPEKIIDGRSRADLLSAPDPERNQLADEPTPHFYFRLGKIEAVRHRQWKLHLPHDYRTVESVGNDGERGRYRNDSIKMALFDLYADPGERYDVAAEHGDVVDKLLAVALRKQSEIDAEKRPPFHPAR